MEPDIKTYIQELRDDREKTKQKEAREKWVKWVSVSLVFIAVLTAFASSKSGSCSGKVARDLNEATFNQSKAADQWSFFQAKAQKQATAEIAKELALQAGNTKKADELIAKIARYEGERKEIATSAEGYEKARDAARDDAELQSKLGSNFGFAVSILQISIAIGSITIMLKKKWLWSITLALGVYGAIWIGYGIHQVNKASEAAAAKAAAAKEAKSAEKPAEKAAPAKTAEAPAKGTEASKEATPAAKPVEAPAKEAAPAR